jgi:hypothetical protein
MRKLLSLLGALVLSAGLVTPVLAQEDLNYASINAATVARDGVVHVSGTIWCGQPMWIHYDGSVSQVIGRTTTLRGGFGGDLWCNGTTPWDGWTLADQGRFSSGWARLDVAFQGNWYCDDESNPDTCYPHAWAGDDAYLKIGRSK